MKRTIKYLASVILSLLLIFSFIALTCSVLLRGRALNPAAYHRIVAEQHLTDKISVRLTNYFTQQENTTGIPVSVYAESLKSENLEPVVDITLRKLFDYVYGVAPDTETKPDFTVLEGDLRKFFEQYAEENGIARDAAFEDALRKNMDAAEKKITTECDVFKTGSLAEAGLLGKARKIYPLTVWLIPVTGAFTLLLLLILFLMYRRTVDRWFYWVASSVLVSSILMLVPSAWLSATNWFDRFAVKSEQIFAAVTGFLYGLTHTVTVYAVCGIAAAVLLYVIAGICGTVRHRKEAVRNAKH